MTTRKFIVLILSGFLLAVFLGYAVFWFVIAGQITNEIKNLYSSAAQSKITIDASSPKVSGFPGKHHLLFSGTLHQGDLTVQIPRLEISGYPLPGQKLLIDLPDGIIFSEPSIDGDLWSLDRLSFSGPIPASLPAAATIESLRKWRDGNSNLIIDSFEANKESLRLTGYGQFNLDSNLQISGYANVVIRGHAAFLGYLENKKLIDQKQKFITSSVFSSLSSQDQENGERFLKASMSIQNGKLFLGPIQIMTLPVIEWPYENTPSQDLE